MDDQISTLIAELASGNQKSLNQLMPAVYAELRRLAGHYMARERAGHTLQPTALLHEAYIRMVGQRSLDWQNRAQLMAIAARMMRRVLLDYAANRHAAKRGGDMARVTLHDDFAVANSGWVDLIDLDRALTQLCEIDAQQASVVELRFFGGMTDDEIAEAIDASPATVRRRWSSAKLWLARRFSETSQADRG